MFIKKEIAYFCRIKLVGGENMLGVIDEDIKNKIYEIRGKQVMLDSDLAKLYHCNLMIFIFN